MRNLTGVWSTLFALLVVTVYAGCRFDPSGEDTSPQFSALEGCFQSTEGSTPRLVRTLWLINPRQSLLNGAWCLVKENIPDIGSQAIITSIEGNVTDSTATRVEARLTATVLPGSVTDVGEQFGLTFSAPLPAGTITVEDAPPPLVRLSVPLQACPCPPVSLLLETAQ